MNYSGGLLCLVAGILTLVQAVAPAEVSGQWARSGRPVQRFDRWLGVGNGAGYHWRTPGPNVEYYQPWSPLNTGGSVLGNAEYFAPTSHFLLSPASAWPGYQNEDLAPARVPTPAIPDFQVTPPTRGEPKPQTAPQLAPPPTRETTWPSPTGTPVRQAQHWFDSLHQQGRIYQR